MPTARVAATGLRSPVGPEGLIGDGVVGVAAEWWMVL